MSWEFTRSGIRAGLSLDRTLEGFLPPSSQSFRILALLVESRIGPVRRGFRRAEMRAASAEAGSLRETVWGCAAYIRRIAVSRVSKSSLSNQTEPYLPGPNQVSPELAPGKTCSQAEILRSGIPADRTARSHWHRHLNVHLRFSSRGYQ